MIRALCLVALLGWPSCFTRSAPPSVPASPPAKDERTQVATPAEARERAAAAEGDAAYWHAYADQLVVAARQEQIERISAWAIVIATITLIASATLTVLTWIRPSLKPLRPLASGAVIAATVTLSLAWILPAWSAGLLWVAIALLAAGIGHLLYRLWRTAHAAEAAVYVSEGLKPLEETEAERTTRKDLQTFLAGRSGPAVDEIRRAMGMA